jgi:hypothetical protein
MADDLDRANDWTTAPERLLEYVLLTVRAPNTGRYCIEWPGMEEGHFM